MLEKLLKKGYFPQELPCVFSTEAYGDALLKREVQNLSPFSYGNKGPKYISECGKYNLARRGKLRRPLCIPNPINYFQLSKLVADNWDEFESIYNGASQSLSKPIQDSTTRALKWDKGFSYLPDAKLKTRTATKYILKADISNFYSSIYTHSIPWAMHTKLTAKKERYFSNNLGNKIDTLLRNGQDQQTKGIPIGTDTSYAIAELIMSEVDKILVNKIGSGYHRFIDDFEFGCKTLQEAESNLAVLQEVLASFELELNTSKTKIIELPLEVDPHWLHKLQKFDIKMFTPAAQKRSLLAFFDMTMVLLDKEPSEPILKYAVIRTSSHIVQSVNYRLYQRILLQWAIAEPSTLPIVIDFIAFYKNAGIDVELSEVKKTLQFIIAENSRQSHTSEVCWAIWGMILLNIEFDSLVVEELKEKENPFIALLTLDAKQRGLIPASTTFDFWASLMTQDELKTGNWLLAYEALLKGWLPSADGSNYLATSDGFNTLSAYNVSFYDPEKLSNYDPKMKYRSFERLNYEQLNYFLYGDAPLGDDVL